MSRNAISHARLMRESTDRLQSALHGSDAKEQLVARRILESPILWQQWESEHSRLMHNVADHTLRRRQVAALKRTSFRLLHGKALFQYLRERHVRGVTRMQVLAHFRPGRSYAQAIIAEHGVYLRKACSFLCANHLGSNVVQDEVFLNPMQRYEELYAEYFNLYCNVLVGHADAEQRPQYALLPLLKHQLNEWRLAILDPRGAQAFLWRETEIRSPTGDTVRLPTLGAWASKGAQAP